MTKPIKWGILGTGRIAHSFAEGLHAVNDDELAAVGSRSKSTADDGPPQQVYLVTLGTVGHLVGFFGHLVP